MAPLGCPSLGRASHGWARVGPADARARAVGGPEAQVALSGGAAARLISQRLNLKKCQPGRVQ